jgi:hypothetical protein
MIKINDLIEEGRMYEVKSEQCGISRRGGRLDVTTADYVYEHEGIQIFIPEGLVYDGCSIPRAIWSILGGPFGKHSFGGMVHDHLYFTRMLPRGIADTVFYDILKNSKVNRFKAWLMYKSVSAFGRKAYYTTDERPIANRLIGEGHKLNPYTNYSQKIWDKFKHAEIYGFDSSPWLTMCDKEFRSAYIGVMSGKLHM